MDVLRKRNSLPGVSSNVKGTLMEIGFSKRQVSLEQAQL